MMNVTHGMREVHGMHGVRGGRTLGLDEARELVHRDDAGKWDVTIPRSELRWYQGQLAFPDEYGEHRLSPSPWAIGQLCTRLGMPTPYFRKCPLELQDAQANHWLRHGAQARNEQWLLRAKDEQLRGALSERYSPLDNAALLETLAPLLPPHYRVQWLGLEDESLHLRIIDPTRPHQVLPNDDFFAGVHLANSEVGCRALTVDALVYRLVCSNGLVALVKGRSLLRQRHIHVAPPRFRAALEEALAQALGATETLLFQLQSAAKQKVPDAGVAIERLAAHWHLSETTQEVAKAALLSEPPPVQESAYGLVNAFTAAAQTLPDEKRYDLELLAGSVAQYGVPRFALSPREALPDHTNAQSRNQEEGTDIVGYARELFEGQVMRRRSTPGEASSTEAKELLEVGELAEVGGRA